MTGPPRDRAGDQGCCRPLRVPGVSGPRRDPVHRATLVGSCTVDPPQEDEADFDLTFAWSSTASCSASTRSCAARHGRRPLKEAAPPPSAIARPHHPAGACLRRELPRAAPRFEVLRTGRGAGHAIKDVHLFVERGSLVAVMGERLGQVHAPHHSPQPREPSSGEVCIGRGVRSRPCRATTKAACAGAASATSSRSSTLGRAHRPPKRRPCPRARRAARKVAQRAAWLASRGSAWRDGPALPDELSAVSASAWHRPGPLVGGAPPVLATSPRGPRLDQRAKR